MIMSVFLWLSSYLGLPQYSAPSSCVCEKNKLVEGSEGWKKPTVGITLQIKKNRVGINVRLKEVEKKGMKEGSKKGKHKMELPGHSLEPIGAFGGWGQMLVSHQHMTSPPAKTSYVIMMPRRLWILKTSMVKP